MNDKNEKKYTAQEVAVAVLKKAEELIKNHRLAKANTAHEIEDGGEPESSNSECPEYLADADIEDSGDGGTAGESKGKGKKKIGEDGKEIPEHEEGLNEEEKEMHDSTESESDEEEIFEEEGAEASERDEEDSDIIEDKEEDSEEGKEEIFEEDDEKDEKDDESEEKDEKKDKKDKKDKKNFEKSEACNKCGQFSSDVKKGPAKLQGFLANKKAKMVKARVDEPFNRKGKQIARRKRNDRMVIDDGGGTRSVIGSPKKPNKANKNSKMEKFLGLEDKKIQPKIGTTQQTKPAPRKEYAVGSNKPSSLAEKINFGGKNK